MDSNDTKRIDNDYIPNPTQSKAHSAYQTYKLFGGARGGGKTVWLVQEAHRLSLQFPGNIGFMGRYQRSDFKRTTLQELLKVIPEELIKSHNQSEGFLEYINGSVIHYAGLSEQEGVSKLKSLNLGWYAWDEASEIPHECFLMIEPAMRHTLPNGQKPPYFRLFATNPRDCWLVDLFFKEGINEPYTFYDTKKGEERTVNLIVTPTTIYVPSLPRDNPHLPDNFEENLRKFYPDDYVKVYLEGDWGANLEGLLLLKSNWVRAAVNREITITKKPVLGVDVARSEQGDETVISYGMGNTLISQDCRRGQSITETSGKIIAEYNSKKVLLTAIERDGLGVGVCDGVKEAKIKHLSVQMGSKENFTDFDKKTYYNMRAKVWWHAREQFEKGLVSIPNDPKLIRQLSGIQFSYRGNGTVIVEPKEETKTRIGGSPDRADSFVLMLWAAGKIRDPATDYRRRVSSVDFMKKPETNPYGWQYEHNYQEVTYA